VSFSIPTYRRESVGPYLKDIKDKPNYTNNNIAETTQIFISQY